MSWRDRLLPASLGGAPFFALSCSVSVGRRVESIDLPMRDDPEYEDMGRRARTYSVTAVILGADYDRERLALVEVLERAGPHVFVHPWWGEFPVIISGAGDFEESVEKGGGVSVTLTLIEAGKQAKLTAEQVPAAALSQAAAAAQAAAQLDFEAEYQLTVGDVVTAAQVALGQAVDAVDAVNNKIAAALGLPDGPLAELDRLKQQVTDLVHTPAALSAALSALLSAVTGLLGLTEWVEEEYPGQAAKVVSDAALETAVAFGAVDVETQPPYENGPVSPDAQRATRAIGKAVRTMSVIGVVQLFADLTPESTAGVGAVLVTIHRLLEQLLADPATSDALHAALTDLRAALERRLDGLTAELPSARTYTPAGAMPALLIAWHLYGDPTRDLEIVARNQVLDPNFVPGGVPLEVLVA